MAIQTRYNYLLRYILPITDVIMLNLVYYLAYFITKDLGTKVSDELNQNTSLFVTYCGWSVRLYLAYILLTGPGGSNAFTEVPGEAWCCTFFCLPFIFYSPETGIFPEHSYCYFMEYCPLHLFSTVLSGPPFNMYC